MVAESEAPQPSRLPFAAAAEGKLVREKAELPHKTALQNLLRLRPDAFFVPVSVRQAVSPFIAPPMEAALRLKQPEAV